VYDEFSFESNPNFIFHDSPGFEAGGEKELQDVLSFLQEKAKSEEVKDQIHAIWCVLSFLDLAQPIMKMTMRSGLFRSERISPVVGMEQRFSMNNLA